MSDKRGGVSSHTIFRMELTYILGDVVETKVVLEVELLKDKEIFPYSACSLSNDKELSIACITGFIFKR